MRFSADVDAGLLSILPMEFIRDNGGVLPKEGNHAFVKKSGKFKVRLRFSGWNGKEDVSSVLSTKEGFYVGDPCYCWGQATNIPHEVWHKVLEDTDYFNGSGNFLACGTGGDGGFTVTATFFKEKE